MGWLYTVFWSRSVFKMAVCLSAGGGVGDPGASAALPFSKSAVSVPCSADAPG